MDNYFSVIPIGISARIMSKLFFRHDAILFGRFLSELALPPQPDEFDNLWKVIAGKNYYNPITMSITEHPLIQNLYKEFIKLRIITNDFFSNIVIKDLVKWVHISETGAIGEEVIYIRIDKNTLDVYSKSGKVPKGNLRDSPYHGFDLIDGYGVIVNTGKYKKRLEDLKK